jgi:hypothetical protein
MNNIIIRPINKIKNHCSGKTTIHKLNQKEYNTEILYNTVTAYLEKNYDIN